MRNYIRPLISEEILACEQYHLIISSSVRPMSFREKNLIDPDPDDGEVLLTYAVQGEVTRYPAVIGTHTFFSGNAILA